MVICRPLPGHQSKKLLLVQLQPLQPRLLWSRRNRSMRPFTSGKGIKEAETMMHTATEETARERKVREAAEVKAEAAERELAIGLLTAAAAAAGTASWPVTFLLTGLWCPARAPTLASLVHAYPGVACTHGCLAAAALWLHDPAPWPVGANHCGLPGPGLTIRTVSPGPKRETPERDSYPPLAYMPGPGTTSKNSFISLLFSNGFRLESPPLPFFPKKILKSKIRPG